MLIYCQHISKRLEYTLDFFLKQLINIDYYLTDDKNVFAATNSKTKICYHDQNFGGLHIIPTGLLSENKIESIDVKSGIWENTTTIFPNKSDISFDLFSAVFYLISRYEEYLPSKKDEHNRFQAKESIAFKYDFLNEPIINVWAEKLKHHLDIDTASKNKYESIISFDIDTAYAFKGKGKRRLILAFMNDLIRFKFSRINLRLNNIKVDPHNSYHYIFNSFKKYDVRNSIFFFLNGKYGAFDKNLNIHSSLQQDLIKRCSEESDIGIHPSYSSNFKEGLLNNELSSLEKVIDKPIIKSRQHYLMLDFPKTYQNLIEHNILQDYTLGYAEKLGFRASTCTPFYWFDLEKNEKTTLEIYPLGVMDGTLKIYLKFAPEEAIKQAKNQINLFKKYNGTFVLLWHNSSFSDLEGWNGWEKVYEEILDYCR